jgi:putative hydrolase of the HAD superfamily
MILSRQGILDRFEALIISSEVGCEKPGERIFRLALDAAGVPAAQCLYVGDNYYDDAVGAASVGMPCLVVNRFGRLGIEEIDAGQPVIRDVREVERHLG